VDLLVARYTVAEANLVKVKTHVHHITSWPKVADLGKWADSPGDRRH